MSFAGTGTPRLLRPETFLTGDYNKHLKKARSALELEQDKTDGMYARPSVSSTTFATAAVDSKSTSPATSAGTASPTA